MMEFYNEKWTTAHIEHRCECCGKRIKAGEVYSRQIGKFCGDFFRRAYCVTCEGAVREYCIGVYDEFQYFDIHDHVRDKFCYDCPDKKPNMHRCDVKNVFQCPKVTEHYKKEYEKRIERRKEV